MAEMTWRSGRASSRVDIGTFAGEGVDCSIGRVGGEVGRFELVSDES